MLIGRHRGLVRLRRETGEGYLASSADLMIGILFIFIIMVVYLAVEIRRVQSEQGPAVDPVRSLVVEVGGRLKNKGVQVELDPDSGVIAFPADALFDRGKFVPRDTALPAIEQTKEVLISVIPCFVGSAKGRSKECPAINPKGVQLETVMVEGHTDSIQYADEARGNNWHLGLDRARYIFDVLGNSQLGSYRNRKGQPILGVASYADTRPAKSNKSRSTDNSLPDSKARDRRVELRFILSYENPEAVGSASVLPKALNEKLQ